MPLTPADVRNKQFSTTRLRPGYDEEEVDAFLDEVESELDRLIQENEELRGKLAECLRGKVPNAGMQEFQQPQEQMQPEPPQPEPAPAPAPPQVEQPMPAMAANMGLPGSEENMDTAARVLALAQQTADQAISDARREADETLGRARHEADDILGKARRQAEQIVNEARARSENLDRDAQERHRQVMGSLVQQREELEHKVEVLKDFEREYRARLKDYFERQLRELAEGGNEPTAPPNLNTTGGFQTMAAPTGGAPAMQHGPAGGPGTNPFAQQQPEPAPHGGFHPGEAPHERR
ncbi:DivIVA domain-containing protein [Nocardiopsis potens]|uniref:DivIVA domain-containing protein n=1 Tax=Nocardiopsis potens TaxID=1246458 RepID=UPI00036ED1A5|nr:DivIVA domain-containing protein [Nocardiopsis potens]